jgi:DNA-binding response OmpR family regulator
MVYSHRADVRAQIINAIGRRPVRELPRVEYLECATAAEVLMAIDGERADIAILDGEAQPTGGMGLCRQIHFESAKVPPVILAVRRAADRWLATWSKADEVLVYPLDPVTSVETVAKVLRTLPAGSAAR